MIGPLRVGLSDVVCRLGGLALLLHRGYQKNETQVTRGRSEKSGGVPLAWSAGWGMRAVRLPFFRQVLIHGHKQGNSDGEVGGLDGDDCHQILCSRQRCCNGGNQH